MIVSARIFFIGGMTSFRALFYWLNPAIYIPSLLIAPVFQILLFAFIGRSAGLASDDFYLIGNALQYAAVPCLFAMSQAIGGERYQNTLSAILVSPAGRIPLFFGRSLPVVLNAAFVAACSLVVGSLILGVHIPSSAYAPIALVVLVAAFSCTGAAIEAARDLAAGWTLGDVSGLVGAEVLIGVIYGIAGYALLRSFEIQSRRHATLDRS